MIAADHLLTDEQMRQFITHGYVVLKNDFSADFHQSVLQKIEHAMSEEGNPGNNILPRVPELQQVFDHPTVRGALTSVLGPDYMMHPHRHCHFNQPGTPDGGWHKDSYWGYNKMRNHHPWWAMIFYYTQDVTEEMGPTAVIPGTQYYRTPAGDGFERKPTISGKAGTMALIQYDLWHRATANRSDINRYMLKFQFIRMKAPESPSWNCQQRDWVLPDTLPENEHKVIWRHMWDWLSGGTPVSAPSNEALGTANIRSLIQNLHDEYPSIRLKSADELGLLGEAAVEAVPMLAKALKEGPEPVALNAAYALANMGEAGRAALLQALRHDVKDVVRNAGYGLAASGEQAIPGLMEALECEEAEARGCAAFALGEMGPAAKVAVPSLSERMSDASEWVRRNVAEALGTVGNSDPLSVPTLMRALQDADEQVRFTAGLALARIGSEAKESVLSLQQALRDENRYVRANAIDALSRIGTAEALQVALRYLQTSRWCPLTTPASTF